MNTVDSLLKIPFSQRSFEEKLEIKSLGRPIPDLNITQTGKAKSSVFKRHFNRNIYTETSWICGCPVRDALFCFPCLLFNGEPSWSKNGVNDLAHLKEYVKRHSENKIHINNVLHLTDIGKVNIATQLDSAYCLSIKKTQQRSGKKSLYFIKNY